MDSKALYNLSYGIFLLGAKSNGKINACITNTCMQVASDPVRVAISVINNNLTCQMIKDSGFFSLSILDKTCSFDFIKNFGYQSGKNVDKFESIDYTEKMACSVLNCKVISAQDLGTHTLFIAEIQDAQILSKNEPLTYAYYQSDLKPKTNVNNSKKIIGWRCKICGYEYKGETLPADFICPICGHPAEDFEPIYES